MAIGLVKPLYFWASIRVLGLEGFSNSSMRVVHGCSVLRAYGPGFREFNVGGLVCRYGFDIRLC